MEALLSIHDLKVHFPIQQGIFSQEKHWVKAVDGVSMDFFLGQTLGLVGESGCGKSTIGKAICQLLKPTQGSIFFAKQDVFNMNRKERKAFCQNVQMVFQDPVESLNPRMNIREIIEEPLIIHRHGNAKERRQRVIQLLDRVGLPISALERYTFEFSGGQRQRIGLARALALSPKLIVCDEPVSALDVSIQAQILNLLLELQHDLGLSYLFISHNLSVVKHISDRVAVMYLGKIVELAPAEMIYKNPKHAYTKSLIAAIPEIALTEKEAVLLEGDLPSPINPPPGSAFGHRIKHPEYDKTIGMDLRLKEIESGHWVAADPCALSPEDYAQLSITHPS